MGLSIYDRVQEISWGRAIRECRYEKGHNAQRDSKKFWEVLICFYLIKIPS